MAFAPRARRGRKERPRLRELLRAMALVGEAADGRAGHRRCLVSRDGGLRGGRSALAQGVRSLGGARRIARARGSGGAAGRIRVRVRGETRRSRIAPARAGSLRRRSTEEDRHAGAVRAMGSAGPRDDAQLPRSRRVDVECRRLVRSLPGDGRPARGARAATRVHRRAQGFLPSRDRPTGDRRRRGVPMIRATAEDRAPTGGLARLASEALLVKASAAALRLCAAGTVSFAGLLLVALVLSSFERTGSQEPIQTSASAYLDFDLAVLRALADRGLAPSAKNDAQGAALALWAHRPDWQLPRSSAVFPRLVGPGEAWAAVASDRSHFRTAARGTADALPFLFAGLALSLLAACAAAVLARLGEVAPRRARTIGVVAGIAGLWLLFVPLVALFDADLFYDRSRSLGLGLAAALFVAGFAAALPGGAARAFFANRPFAQHLGALGRWRTLTTVARFAALDATEWLVPLVPALAAAAVFVCAKADQDATSAAAPSGLGALIRAAMTEPSVFERIGTSALIASALVVLWYLGHRFLLEVRESLSAQRRGP